MQVIFVLNKVYKLGSPSFPRHRSSTGSSPFLCYLLAWPSYLILHTLPLSSLLIFHVTYSPSLHILIRPSVFDCRLSLQPPAHAGSSLADFSALKM
jgi:hypothetical protein